MCLFNWRRRARPDYGSCFWLRWSRVNPLWRGLGTWKWWGLIHEGLWYYYFIDGWSLRNGEVKLRRVASPVAGWSNAGPLIYCISLPVPLLVQVSHTKFNCCNSLATLLVDRLLKFSAREKLTDFWVIDPCPQIQSNISGYEWLIWY